ncbi:MAG: GNAT family N-acetyltransferase [Anaerolineae bacterium]|nr:GNAT family N-acetyltransferase [Anaerolineae bacterium]
MNLHIRPVVEADIDKLVQLSLAAWVPVFASFREILGPEINGFLNPNWEQSQSALVEKVCHDEETLVYVAEVEGMVVGFIAYKLNNENKNGEVWLLAVDPTYQNAGAGTELNRFVLDKMKAAGMKLAVVETGGDPSHAPARRSYEKAGYTPFPIVRYFKYLEI